MLTSKIFLNYTDYHSVDEDEMTITHYGGDWPADENLAGVACRSVDNISSSASILVASLKNKD